MVFEHVRGCLLSVSQTVRVGTKDPMMSKSATILHVIRTVNLEFTTGETDFRSVLLPRYKPQDFRAPTIHAAP
jgi:hypothetical protein